MQLDNCQPDETISIEASTTEMSEYLSHLLLRLLLPDQVDQVLVTCTSATGL